MADIDPNASFADILYKEITDVIGGNNSNQFFCMSLPGTSLEASQYTYDVKNGQPKPAHVKVNESKLVNKLYDAAFMSASSNGRHLHTQYRTALNMLTPKMNGKLFEAKKQLRQALMTPYPYDFGDGEVHAMTLEQVFYRLYGEYVVAKQEWAKKQLDKKNELALKYPRETAEDYIKRDDEFLEWYGVVAEAEELLVQEKIGKVLNVFSPGDMEIINGILESGTGRELTEARMQLDNVEEMNPDGGYVYPVTLYPEDWFDLLDTSFTPIDLLQSPAALAQQLTTLEMQRSSITANLNNYLKIAPIEEVNNLREAYDNCEKQFQNELANYQNVTVDCTVDMLKSIVDIAISRGADENTDDAGKVIPDSAVARVMGIDTSKVSDIMGQLSSSIKNCIGLQKNLVSSAADTTQKAVEWMEAHNKVQLRDMIVPLQQQLDEINIKIEALKDQIKLAIYAQPDSETDTEGNEVEKRGAVTPNSIPDRFTQIIIDSTMSQVSNSSSKETSAEESSHGVSFFFGGYTSNSSHQSAVETAFSENSSMEIKIGMSVAKVEIDREWFNPAVFMLTEDMYNTSSGHIAPKEDYNGFNQERLKDMNNCIFPCFPTSFVIARDVTIQFYSEHGISSSFAESVEEHSSKGGGFFIFGGSKSSSSSSSSSNSVATSSSQSVTVRFTAPQILGYYLEALPSDKSTNISNAQTDYNADFISIFEFISAFQEMLDEHNKKYNSKLLDLVTEE
jgi:hypothetical protein